MGEVVFFFFVFFFPLLQGGVETVAFTTHFGVVLVTGTMARACPVLSVLFSARHMEDN